MAGILLIVYNFANKIRKFVEQENLPRVKVSLEWFTCHQENDESALVRTASCPFRLVGCEKCTVAIKSISGAWRVMECCCTKSTGKGSLKSAS